MTFSYRKSRDAKQDRFGISLSSIISVQDVIRTLYKFPKGSTRLFVVTTHKRQLVLFCTENDFRDWMNAFAAVTTIPQRPKLIPATEPDKAKNETEPNEALNKNPTEAQNRMVQKPTICSLINRRRNNNDIAENNKNNKNSKPDDNERIESSSDKKSKNEDANKQITNLNEFNDHNYLDNQSQLAQRKSNLLNKRQEIQNQVQEEHPLVKPPTIIQKEIKTEVKSNKHSLSNSICKIKFTENAVEPLKLDKLDFIGDKFMTLDPKPVEPKVIKYYNMNDKLSNTIDNDAMTASVKQPEIHRIIKPPPKLNPEDVQNILSNQANTDVKKAKFIRKFSKNNSKLNNNDEPKNAETTPLQSKFNKLMLNLTATQNVSDYNHTLVTPMSCMSNTSNVSDISDLGSELFEDKYNSSFVSPASNDKIINKSKHFFSLNKKVESLAPSPTSAVTKFRRRHYKTTSNISNNNSNTIDDNWDD